MLESLITSRTRIKLLLKFFSNSKSSAHLRGLAKEMHESTNAVRLELNKLSKAGFLVSFDEGNTIQYRANEKHPLFPELKSLVRKYLGLDKVVENIVNQIGDISYAFITGDYAEGKDTGVIELVIVGEVDNEKLSYWVKKTEALINRKVSALVLSLESYPGWKAKGYLDNSIVLWNNNAAE
ncbi:MAG: hypothetical protein WBP43_11045 [Chitinophagales bacterium]